MVSVIEFIFCVSYLFGLIPTKIGILIIFPYAGCKLLFKGFNSKSKNKHSKKLSISFGVLSIILFIISIGLIVIPVGYF